MDPSRHFGRHLNRRSAIALTVVLGHGVLLVMLLRAALMPGPSPVQSIVVSLLEPNGRRPEIPNLYHPELARVMSVIVPEPEIDVAGEAPADAPSAVVAVTDQKVQATSDPAGEGEALPTMSNVAYLQQPAPRYPPQSRRAREEGLVILRVTIDESGRVVSVEIQQSSGHPRLDEAARSAVARALFKPYVLGGVARASSATIPIEFSLHAASS